MYYTIDRFEADFALLEDENGVMCQIPRSDLPLEAREGDKLEVSEEGCAILTEATQAARTEAEERLQRLLNRTQNRRERA